MTKVQKLIIERIKDLSDKKHRIEKGENVWFANIKAIDEWIEFNKQLYINICSPKVKNERRLH